MDNKVASEINSISAENAAQLTSVAGNIRPRQLVAEEVSQESGELLRVAAFIDAQATVYPSDALEEKLFAILLRWPTALDCSRMVR